jgi:SPW repeat
MVPTKYWRNLATILAGAWLLVSPWVMNYHDMQYAKWSAVAVGVILIGSEWVAFVRPGAWEELLDLVLGCYLLASPYALGYSANIKVSDNTAMIGVFVLGLAIVGLIDDPKAQRWWHDHTHLPG